jgi:transcriptional regulator GlxA family with amidase domain
MAYECLVYWGLAVSYLKSVGATAGIDFGLALVGRIAGDELAKTIQLASEETVKRVKAIFSN